MKARGHGEQLRFSSVRGQERPSVKVQATSIAVKDPRLKGPCREAEAWQRVKRAQARVLVKA